MDQLKSIVRNLRLLLTQELGEQINQLEHRLQERGERFEQALQERSENLERALHERAANYERAVDERLDERLASLERRTDLHEATLDARLEERLTNHETRADERWATMESVLGARFDERQIELELRADERQEQLDLRADERQQQVELGLDRRFDERAQETDTRLEERLLALDHRMESRLRAIDNRIDDRFAKVEKQIDERFGALEHRLDARAETHERKTDRNLKQNREDIIDRSDVMLQIFEQRVEKQRRELESLRATLGSNGKSPSGSIPTLAPINLTEALQIGTAAQQIVSFRRLSESSGLLAKPKLQSTDTTFYQRILDWKNVSADGLNQFTLDEQEVVDYILSFIADPADRHYTMQHMRRLLGTLQRIPPPQSSTDRLLELGSLSHIVPAIKKFCGYNEICGADVWDGDNVVSTETLQQQTGKEHVSFELRNFNVERDPFPYADGHFRVALCCELIEHLQSDPMHMLWECNRVLAPDGFLLLTTPNIASARSIEGVLIGCTPYLLSQYNRQTPVDQHNREYAPYEVGIALAAAGFSVVALETEDVWLRSNPAILELLEKVNLPTDMRGDNIFALARKTGAPVERYPKELYVD